MAKKKKRSSKKKTTSRKKVASVPKEPNMFLRRTIAIAYFVLATLLFLGGFETGGGLPESMFDLVEKGLGFAAYLTPIALAYWGYHKLRSDEHVIPFANIVSMGSLLLFLSSWLHVAFYEAPTVQTEVAASDGGAIGELIGGGLLSALDKVPASIALFVLTVLAAMWAFSIPFTAFVKLFERKEKSDTDIADLKAAAPAEQQKKMPSFKLNQGVPVITDSEKNEQKAQKRATMKNSAVKLTPE